MRAKDVKINGDDQGCQETLVNGELSQMHVQRTLRAFAQNRTSGVYQCPGEGCYKEVIMTCGKLRVALKQE